MDINMLDLVAVIIIAASSYAGFQYGVVKDLSVTAVWVLGFLGMIFGLSHFLPAFQGIFGDNDFSLVVTLVVLFASCFLMADTVRNIFGRVMTVKVDSGIDRPLAAFLGVLRGIAGISFFLMIAVSIAPSLANQSTYQTSRFMRYFERTQDGIAAILPDSFAHNIRLMELKQKKSDLSVGHLKETLGIDGQPAKQSWKKPEDKHSSDDGDSSFLDSLFTPNSSEPMPAVQVDAPKENIKQENLKIDDKRSLPNGATTPKSSTSPSQSTLTDKDKETP